MLLSKSKAIIAAGLILPFIFVYHVILAVLYISDPSPKLISVETSAYGYLVMFLFATAFIFVMALRFVVAPKQFSYCSKLFDRANSKNNLGLFDQTVVIFLTLLHLYIIWKSDGSPRHSDAGISSLGMVAFLYYFIKPTFALVLFKYCSIERKNASFSVIFLCVMLAVYNTSALDFYYILFLFFAGALSKFSLYSPKMIFVFIFLFLGILGVIYSGITLKNSFESNIVKNELQYRYGTYHTSFFHNFYNKKNNASSLFEVVASVNNYRISRILFGVSQKPDVESVNRLNFIQTNKWDAPNRPGASPGMWASVLMSPLLFILCLPIYFLVVRFIRRNTFHFKRGANLFLVVGFASPLFFPILASPFDFIFILSGGTFFIFYLVFERLLNRMSLRIKKRPLNISEVYP